MSVFTIVNVFSPGVKGGGPAQSLAHLLHATELEVRVFTCAFDLDGTKLDVVTDQWVNWEINSNVKIYYSSNKGFRQFLQIYQEIAKLKPCVVWVNSFFDFRYSIFPQLAARLNGRPVVLSPRGELMNGAISIKKFKKILFIYFQKILYRVFPPRFHFTSEEELSDAESYFRRYDSFLFPNFSRMPSSKSYVESCASSRSLGKKIVFLARLVPKKGLDIALRILSELDKEYSLEVYGEFEDPVYGEEISQLISAFRLSDRVNFRGFITFEEALPQISRCRFLLSPTRGENFGHSIYECLSVGLPVIVSDQTPWKSSLGVRVCRLNDIGAYVNEIKTMEMHDPNALALSAWNQAKSYYDTLPASTVFVRSLVSGNCIAPQSHNMQHKEH
jgi:glycosyltransferase involved in cell wall biosynthesis